MPSYEGLQWDFLRALASIIWSITWTDIIGIALVVTLVPLLWHVQRDPNNNFDISDLFLGDITRRADIYKVIISVMAALGVWVIVKLINAERYNEVVTLLPIVLGVFVAGRAAGTIWGRSAEPPPEVRRDCDEEAKK